MQKPSLYRLPARILLILTVLYLLLFAVFFLRDTSALLWLILGWKFVVSIGLSGILLLVLERQAEKKWQAAWIPGVIAWSLVIIVTAILYSSKLVLALIILAGAILNSRSVKFYEKLSGRNRIFFAVLLLLGLLIAKGIIPPLWSIYKSNVRFIFTIIFENNYIMLFPILFPVIFMTPLLAFLLYLSGWKNTAVTAGRVSSYFVGAIILPVFLELMCFPQCCQTTPSPGVTRLLPGEFSQLQIDRSNERLLCTDKRNKLLVFNLTTEKAEYSSQYEYDFEELQNIELDEGRRIIYHFDRRKKELVEIDAESYQLLKRNPIQESCDGSAWLELDIKSGRLFTVCENGDLLVLSVPEYRLIKKFYIGKITDVLLSRKFNKLFISLGDRKEILIIDTKTLSPHKVTIPGQGDQLTISEKLDSLFVSAPMSSSVIQIDLKDMNSIKEIKSIWGARTMAIDDSRNLLFVGSLFTPGLEAIDLKSNKRKSLKVGKWQRRILFDDVNNRLFVSTAIDGLLIVPYSTLTTPN